MPKRQSFIQGSIILVAAMVVSKVIGAIFKIPLTNILGGTGMGYFSTAYGLFAPVYSVAAGGLPTAIVKLVAESVAQGKYENARRIKRVALLAFTVIGLLGSLIVFIFARPFAGSVAGNPQAYLAVVAISPAVLFCCIMAVYRGYYEGMRNMFPTAASQVVEAIVKLVLGLGLSMGVLKLATWQYDETGMVFGVEAFTYEQATMIALPYCAAAAILGVTLSSFAGMMYVFLRHRFKGDGCTACDLAINGEVEHRREILKKLVGFAIPIAIGGVVISLTSLIDLATIIRGLSRAIDSNTPYFIEKFGYALTSEVGIDELANFMYGSYTGLAVAMFTLVPSFTAMLGKSALPNIAAAWAIKDQNRVSRNIEAVMRVTTLFAIPAGIGISTMAKPILLLLYGGRLSEVEIASAPLSIMGIGAIMLAVTSPLFAMLQAIGRADLPVKLMVVGTVVKLVGNMVLIPLPQVNLLGAPISTTVCYFIIAVMASVALFSRTGVKINASAVFVKPLIGGLACGISARVAYNALESVIAGSMRTLISVAIGGIIYLIILIATGGMTKKEILSVLKR